jgi:hypothetical protein
MGPARNEEEHHMKNELVGMELSDAELASVQGGGFGSWLKGAVKDVGNAAKKAGNWVATAAKDAYEWAKGDGSGIVAVVAAVGTVALALEEAY